MVPIETLSVSSLLSVERVRVGLSGGAKEEIIASVVGLLEGSPGVTDLALVLEDVLRREAVMSTGVGRGLALPHARTAGVTTTLAAFATMATPLDYDAFDDEPVRLVLLLVGPDAERGAHVRLLSRFSRMMSDDAFRAELLEADSPEAVVEAFTRAEERLA
jgi:PTS system fructose-specific IIA component